jgi:hypothetical protein
MVSLTTLIRLSASRTISAAFSKHMIPALGALKVLFTIEGG